MLVKSFFWSSSKLNKSFVKTVFPNLTKESHGDQRLSETTHPLLVQAYPLLVVRAQLTFIWSLPIFFVMKAALNATALYAIARETLPELYL